MKAFVKTLKITSTILVALMAVLAFLLVGVRLFGLKVYTIVSPSMEPEYPVGSLIYVRPAESEDLNEKDVLTYQLSPTTTATHRIHEVFYENGVRMFRTKGDANGDVDKGAVAPSQVIGTPVLCIPLLGILAMFIQHPPGLYVAIAAGAFLILLVIITDILEGEMKKKQAEATPGRRGKQDPATSEDDGDEDDEPEIPDLE